MGYSTDFEGRFTITPQLTMDQFAELAAVQEWPGAGRSGGGYVQWTPTKDGKGLTWDGNEKFYEYVECLEWLMKTYFARWGCTLSGSVKYKGESRDDRGVIVVEGGKVEKRPSGLFAKGATPLETATNALREIASAAREWDEKRSLEVADAALALLEAKPLPRRSG